ncbi:hypothetical protein HYV88_02790 [Candidatus Woesearchaeota archaeon]|nr:hypothetical protein [Candidatus Woesearchaeota archaeon]
MGDEKKPGFLVKLIGSSEKEEEKSKEPEDILKAGKVTYFKADDEGKSEQIQYNLILDSMQAGVEGNYYWILRFMTSKNLSFGLGMTVEKIRDIFTASEASSFWGNVEQRKGLQQDKVSQYMATIGKLIKDMFQIIRELRILDERLAYYDGYNKRGKKNEPLDEPSCIALKGTWIDLVEGGAKNPASVYGLASQVGFSTLPDLFFTIHPNKVEDIDREVKKLKDVGFNRKVQEVLSRKLKQFLEWKEKTERELRNRKIFVLKYLRMHFNNIKLYTSWIKPYLRAIKALQSGPSYKTPDVSSAFETNLIELEIIGYLDKYSITNEEGFEQEYKFEKYFPCVLVKFKYVAMPMMAYQKEYQRGPIHTGRTQISIEPYVLTKDQINEYRIAKERKDLEEVEDLIPSLEGSLSSLGEELDKYLKEAGEEIKSKEKEKPKQIEGLFSPFINIFKGIGEIFSFKKSSKEKKPMSKKLEQREKSAASGLAKARSFILYDIFKKGHGMLAP